MVEPRSGVHNWRHRDWDALASRLGVEAVAAGDPTRWYEEIWSAGARGEVDMPWDRDAPHDVLAAHVAGRTGAGLRAVVVGAGFGADAELLAGLGYDVVAFDIAASAVAAARERHPGSSVDYRVADLLDLPAELVGAFDLVAEVYTVQALHPSLRAAAVSGVRRLVAPGGELLVVQMVREDGEPVGEEPPWLLDRAEMEALAGDGVEAASLDRAPNPTRPEGRDRWRMVLTRR
jgi:SAM-dependent methyltransferase